MGNATLARSLGWFSIGLGLAEVTAARDLGRYLGMEGSVGLLRVFGLREIATGAAILASDDPTPWVWGRVGGDALDLAALAVGLGPSNPKRGRVGAAIAAIVGITALDAFCAQRRSREDRDRLIADGWRGRSGAGRRA